MNGSKEVVFLVIEHVIAHGNTRRYKLCNATFHHLVHLAQSLFALNHGALLLRIFKLVADSYTFSCTDKLGEVGV